MTELLAVGKVHLLTADCMSEKGDPYLANDTTCTLRLSGGSVQAKIRVFPKRLGRARYGSKEQKVHSRKKT